MTYGYEDMDYKTNGDASTGYAYNAAESKFFCRIRDLFQTELQQMYIQLESQGCWSANDLITQFDKMQDQFPEELWRLDIQRKYIRSYLEGSTKFVNQMMNGKKKYQRRQFERAQEKYIATKYFGNNIVTDQIMFRCNTPTDANIAVKPNYTLHLTPYADMYLDVLFGATYRTQIRAEAGKQYDIECPFETMDDTAVLIYCASQIQSVGDISALYIHDNDFSKASKLKELIIGNTTKGYSNNFLTNLGIGKNTLLRKLDIQNTPNLAQALNLSQCKNLEELFAKGSGLTGVTFAKGGNLKVADLPAVQSLTLKNLAMITDFEVESFDNLLTLVCENSNVPVLDILTNANNLNRVRIIGINWELENTSMLDRIYGMTGVDKDGYNLIQSVLAGDVFVPVMKEQLLADYKSAWADINITYNTLVQQFAVTFVNDDGSILDVQYVDKGSMPVNPITRPANPIPIPTKESTVQYSFTFDAWDSELVPVFEPTTIRATYTQSVRRYNVTFMNHGNVLKNVIAPYGTTVFYDGDNPTYTAEEGAYKYYLFSGWDKSGYVNGDKTINAVYDSCEYTTSHFRDKLLPDLRPVEIYTLIKTEKYEDFVEEKDTISLQMGNDINFEDVEQNEFIQDNEPKVFTGKNYIDTQVALMDEDRDFVIAIDYSFNGSGVLAQCYKSDGSSGFRLQNTTQPQVTWGTQSSYVNGAGNRDIVVLRHVKGENQLHVYKGNLPSETITYETLTSNRNPQINSTLVFGCSKADDGRYENYGNGTIYWCKAWYADLGDEVCRSLAIWTHESIEMEMYGFRQYYLSDNSGKRSSMSFVAKNLLNNSMPLSNTGTNAGGFTGSSLSKILNNRMYSAINSQWKQLLKEVKIVSTVGEKQNDTSTENCYIAIPSISEVASSMNYEPYSFEGSTIPFITSDETRKRTLADGTARSYWTRSPNVSYNTYYWIVEDTGTINGYQYGTYDQGVLIIISM